MEQLSTGYLKITLNEELARYLNSKDITLTEAAILKCYYSQNKALHEAIMSGKNVNQRMALLAPMVRKQLLVDYETESWYVITDYGRAIVDEMTQIELVGYPTMSDLTGVPHVAPSTEFEIFITTYLDIFPKGVKNGGNKPLRSNKTDVGNKMIKFMNKYKYDKETILKATKNFVERLRGTYTYCPTAEYFILKDGSSALATECDLVKNGLSNEQIINPFEKRM